MILKNAVQRAGQSKIGRLMAPKLRCSFCRRRAEEVGRLVAGASAYICDDCIVKCVAILETHGGLDPTRAKH